MKIAKKVLAVAMAVAMIACFAAMAFAAPADASYKVTLADGSDAGYTYALALSIEKGVGFTAGGVTIGYNPDVLVYQEDLTDGADVEAMGRLIKSANSFTYEANGEEAGKIVSEFYFKENLWTTEEFLANKKGNAKEEDVKAIDVNSFEIIIFYFELADGAKAEDIEVTLTANGANFLVDGEKVSYPEIKCEGIEKKVEEPTTAEPTTAEPTTAEPTTAEPTTAEPTTAEPTTAEPTTDEAPSTPEETTAKGETDKGPATGDTGVLAIAAGVVALAGAAFVVSKKRK